MRNRRNFYRVLHVQPDAPAAVLKSSYRALMLSLEMHPDRGGEHWNAALINEAYTVLSDPQRRSAYDETLDLASAAGVRGQREGADPVGGEEPVPPRESRPDPCCLFCGSAGASVEASTGAVVCGECRSPLMPAGAPELEASGRRAARRVEMEAAMRYYTDWPQSRGMAARILDLSPGGLRFESVKPLDEFRIIKIDAPLLAATARVVVCRGSGMRHEVGVQFYTVHFNSREGTFLSTTA